MKLKNGDEIKQGHSFDMQMLQKKSKKFTNSQFNCITSKGPYFNYVSM